MDTPSRHLVSQIRDVASDIEAAYHSRWQELRGMVVGQGAHAWRFRSTIQPRRYVEFLEFAAGSDPRDDSAVAGALRALDSDVGGSSARAEEWEGEV